VVHDKTKKKKKKKMTQQNSSTTQPKKYSVLFITKTFALFLELFEKLTDDPQFFR
jgi:hypothetical protein